MKRESGGTIQLLPRNIGWLLRRFYLFTVMLVRSGAYHAYLFKISNRQFSGLNLGCAGTRIKGFCNIDASPRALCDVVARIDRLKLSPDSVGTIYSSHVFEHIPRAQAATILAEWYRVLKPGGKLYICVPDQEVLFRIYLDNLPSYDTEKGRYLVDRACYLTYGGQANRYDFHFYGYSFTTLRHLLESVGYANVQRFDHSRADVMLPNDISLVQIDGLPMSLNIEASKQASSGDDTRS